MYIGYLNDKIKKLDYQLYKKDTHEIPELFESGNPFLGERISVDWKQLYDTGVDIEVSLEEGYFLNEVVLSLATRSIPKSIRLFDADKKTELYCYSGETGKTIQNKVISLPIESCTNRFVIEINVEFSDVAIKNIALYGADFSGEMLFPTPVTCSVSDANCISVTALDSYSCDSEAESAGRILEEKYEELTGIHLTQKESGKIRLTMSDEVEENGYRLCVESDTVIIEASDYRGLVYGVEVFLKLISDDMIPECKIQDYPRMPFRGVHLMIPHPDQFDFAKRLVKYVISPMGYNCIIMEVAGGMEFKSHPEINDAVRDAVQRAQSGEWPRFPHAGAGCGATVPQELVRDFVAYSREFGVDVIPEIQSLGHVQFMTIAHPDITERADKEEEKEEIDGKDADIPPNEFYGHSYCPSNPKSYEILFDLIDEIVDVFTPKKYVHMGHDEVYQIGVCPKCKDKEPAQLLAEDINRIYDYLAKKGLKMMIWADMFQRETKYKTAAAIGAIPKDIILLDFVWYFYMNDDIEDNLLAKDFKVVMGNMYSSHYPRYESRIVKDGMIGAQTSTWTPTNEYAIAKEGKMYELLYSAQMMWSANYTSHARYSYDAVVRGLMPTMREHMKDIRYPSLMKGTSEEVVVDNGAYNPEQSNCEKSYIIGKKAESIIFEHATTQKLVRIPWATLEEIGSYEVCYEDGTTATVPLNYSGNISYWNRRHSEPFTHKYYRHNGYQAVSYETEGIETKDMEHGYITMYRYEWINPNQDKKIMSVQYVPKEENKTDVYISRMLIVKGAL